MSLLSPSLVSRRIFTDPKEDHRRFLTQADGEQILQRLIRATSGGGFTAVTVVSNWTGNVRWARNRISTAGDVLNHTVTVHRSIRGAWGHVTINNPSPDALVAATERAERVALTREESVVVDPAIGRALTATPTPALFDDPTYNLTADERADAAHTLIQSGKDAGMLSAGYVAVSGKSMAALDTLGRQRYFQWTEAQYSVTVRDPKGLGSGWAGVDATAWGRIDGATLSRIALDKCLRAQNSARVEPGRYTTILEPQAVADLITFGTVPRGTKLGTKIIDARLTTSADPMDPDMGFPPWVPGFIGAELGDFSTLAGINIEHGVLRQWWDGDHPLRMSGGSTTIDEMIATTQRGLLVTRLQMLAFLDDATYLCNGVTRDGLWLIENGKISRPANNLIFTESPLFALNNVEQIGVPQRVFHSTYWPEDAGPPYIVPRIVPALKVRDFSFTSLTDAV